VKHGRFFWSMACTVALLGAAPPATPSAQAQPPALFQQAPGPPARNSTQRHRFVRIDSNLLASGGEVTLNLFDDLVVKSRGVRVDVRANGLESWSSRIENDRLGYALFVGRGQRVLGQIEVDGSVFQVRPVGGPVHEIVEIDVGSLPPEAEPVGAEEAGSPAASVARVARSVPRDSVDSIRVLVVYTPAAAAASADIEAEAQLAIDAANTAYENSEMLTRLELVATAPTAYVENGNIHEDLGHLANQEDGEMDEVHALRNAWLADFVALLIEDSPDYCGLAALMSVVSPEFESSAFSVTYRPCAVGNLTLAHEIGHNMGCHHDRANADSAPAYSWAYGFQDPEGDFRTVMAIVSGCPAPCTRVAQFSNPDVLWLGDPTGVDPGEEDAAACALAIDATSTVTCDFRTLEPPGMLEATSTFTDRIEVSFSHPWPWSFQVYRAESGGTMLPLQVTADSPFSDATAVAGTSYDYWVSTRSMIDGNSQVVGPVTGVRAVAMCGNSIPESPAEDCDDGNAIHGDGCAPDCMFEVALGEAEADCVYAVNVRATRVSRAQAKENLACLLAAASGSQPDADACVTTDLRGKVAKARAKVVSIEASACTIAPDVGYTGSIVASDAAENERRAFLLDLFGSDLSTAVIAKADDAGGASCQKSLAKAADKLLASQLAAFLACKKDRLASGAVYATGNLEACFDVVAGQAIDGSSKLAMALEKLSSARLRKCSTVDLAAAFPGECGAWTGSTFDACVAASASCRACRLFNGADALARDCDLFDNAAADSSCSP
jgi:peptidyl-Asp metalloendopeptidase